MGHPCPAPPPSMRGPELARWYKTNKVLSGAPARTERVLRSMRVPQSASKIRKRLPAVCFASSLGLDKGSSIKHIVNVFRQLRESTTAPHSLLIYNLKNFNDECLDALLAVLRRQPRIFALNIGEATSRLSLAALDRLVAHLNSSHGARIACLYLGDTGVAEHARIAARAATGARRRKETEAIAWSILVAEESTSKRARERARWLVPWRNPHVWRELDSAPGVDAGNTTKWAMPTWHPKKYWKELW
jgi:hypothetical protein